MTMSTAAIVENLLNLKQILIDYGLRHCLFVCLFLDRITFGFCQSNSFGLMFVCFFKFWAGATPDPLLTLQIMPCTILIFVLLLLFVLSMKIFQLQHFPPIITRGSEVKCAWQNKMKGL